MTTTSSISSSTTPTTSTTTASSSSTTPTTTTTTVTPTASASSSSQGAAILTALGATNGIDTTSLVNNLVNANQMADMNALTTKQNLLQTQISDFGLLTSAFSTLETAASVLANPDTFNAKSASIPTTSLLSVGALDASAATGNYAINVDQVAQAQSLSSTGFSSQTAPIGKGTLAIRFGNWTSGTFTPNTSQTGATITIDDSNNSLIGLQNSINNAKLGINASIVSDSGSYKLLLTSPSGSTSEMEITATEDAGAQGLAAFNFNKNSSQMTQQQGGADAKLRVNGMPLTRSSNHLTDVIPGLTFDLANSSTTETVNIGITQDKTGADTAIRNFVAAYNTFLTNSGKLVGFDSSKNANGSLSQDPLAKNLLQQVRNQLNGNVPGLSGVFTTLSNLGIATQLDGSLKIDDSTATTSFATAMANNYDAVRDLFVPKMTSSNAQISVTKNTANSTPGTYQIAITQQPTKGSLIGGAITGSFPLDTTGKNYTFTVGVDGVTAAPITLPTTTYASGDALAADLQARINSDSNLLAGKVGLSVKFNTTTNKLEFTSNNYGSSSNVSFSAASSDMADFGITNVAGTAGTDVAGTVDGVAAFGYGNVLLPAIGSKAEGLSMTIQPGATSGTISFSKGFAGSFTGLIDNFLQNNGLIQNHETVINQQISKVGDDVTALNARSDAYRAQLQAQFSAMQSIVNTLKSTGTFLTGAFAALNGTTTTSK